MTLRNRAGTRVGGRYELLVELQGGEPAVRYEAVDVDGSRCVIALIKGARLENLRRPRDAAWLDSGTDDALGCAYVVEPLVPTSVRAAVEARLGGELAGRLIDETYRIVSRLGGGGMGTVYEAETASGDRVALKLASRALPNPHDVRRMLREGRAAMQLASKHVARVITSGADRGTSAPFLVMELLRGEDLGRVLAREGALEPAVAARIALDACRGLAEAHAAGLVHRDVKPSNIFLHREGGEILVKVCDFGLVKERDISPDETSMTRTGALIGSPRYMSPEQARDSSAVDRRTDIWSLAATLYESLAGVPPWANSKTVMEVLMNLQASDLPSLRDVARWIHGDLARVVHRGLARRPEDRYASSAEFAAALEPFALSGSIAPFMVAGRRPDLGHLEAPPPETVPIVAAAPPKKVSRRVVIGAGLAAGIFAGIGGSFGLSKLLRDAEPELSQPTSADEDASTEPPKKRNLGELQLRELENLATDAGFQVTSSHESKNGTKSLSVAFAPATSESFAIILIPKLAGTGSMLEDFGRFVLDTNRGVWTTYAYVIEGRSALLLSSNTELALPPFDRLVKAFAYTARGDNAGGGDPAGQAAGTRVVPWSAKRLAALSSEELQSRLRAAGITPGVATGGIGPVPLRIALERGGESGTLRLLYEGGAEVLAEQRREKQRFAFVRDGGALLLMDGSGDLSSPDLLARVLVDLDLKIESEPPF